MDEMPTKIKWKKDTQPLYIGQFQKKKKKNKQEEGGMVG